ncbi:MAG TPA: YfhO family protein, partial [Thermoanaerobaculia bacterium]
AVGIAAAAAAAVQLLPAVDLVRDTPRSHAFPFSLVAQWSTPPVRLLDLLIPEFSGSAAGHFRLYWGTASYGWLDPFFVGIYFGLIPIALALAALTLRLPGWKAITFTFAAATLLALGSHTPLLRVLYALRLFSSFRYPEKFLILGIVPLMFFSAVAFDRAIGGDRSILRRALIIATIPAAICAILIGFSLHPSYLSQFVAFWNVAIHPGAALMARVSRTVFLVALIRSVASIAVLWYAVHRSPRKWAPIAIFVTLLDLGYQRLLIAETVSGDFFRVPPRALGQIRPGVRVFHQADWYSATPVARRYLDLPQMYWVLRNGLYPMFGATWGVPVAMNRDIDETFIAPATDFNVAVAELRRRNVPRWFEPLMAMSAAGYRALYLPFDQQTGRFRNNVDAIEPNIFVPVRTNSIFYFADRVVNCKSRDQFIDLVARGAATPRSAFADLVAAPLADGRILSIRQRSNAADLDIESAGNALLVCSITRHKYWRAAIDGHDTRLIPVNLQYQGVFVPAGRHTIRIAYRNPLLIVGASISIVALAALVALMLRKGHGVRKEI